MKKILFVIGLVLSLSTQAQSVFIPGFGSWKAPVASIGALPASGNAAGDARVAKDTGIVYAWDGAAWVPQGGGGGSGVVLGDPATGFTPGSIQYVDQSGNQAEDNQFTRSSATNYTTMTRNFNLTANQVTAVTGFVLIIGNISGTFNDGDQLLDTTNGTSTATVGHAIDLGGGTSYALILSAWSGSFANPDALLNTTDGTSTANVGQYFSTPFVANDPVFITDVVTSTLDGQGTLVSVSGNNYDLGIITGTAPQYDLLFDSQSNPTKVVGLLSVVSTPIAIPVNTGFITDNNYAGVGLDGSYMHIDDGTNRLDFGVFNLQPFSGLPTTAGIVSLGDAGSISTFIINPAGDASSANIAVQDKTSNTANLYLNGTGNFTLSAKDNGVGAENGFNSDGVKPKWFSGNKYFSFPITTPSTGQVLYASNVSGDFTTLDWLTPSGGGGTPGGSQYEIQYNDGAGGFAASSNLSFDGTNFLLNADTGINVSPTGGIQTFGNFNEVGRRNQLIFNNGNSDFSFQADVPYTSSITFTGSGPNNMSADPTSWGGAIPTTFDITIDTPATQVYAGSFYVPQSTPALDDAVYSGTWSPTSNQLISVYIDSIAGPDTFGWSINGVSQASGVTITPATPQSLGSTGLSITFAADTGHALSDRWDTAYGYGNPTYVISNRVGAATLGATMTASISGTTATLVYDGTSQANLSIISGPGFVTGDVLDDGSGNSFDLNYIVNIADTFNWTDDGGATNHPGTPIYGTGYILLEPGCYILFSTVDGHTVGDNWSFSILYNYGSKIQSINRNQNNFIAIGDIDGNFSSDPFKTRLTVDIFQERIFNFAKLVQLGDGTNSGNSTIFSMQDSSESMSFSSGTNGTIFSANGASGQVKVGDTNDFVKVDVANGTTEIKNTKQVLLNNGIVEAGVDAQGYGNTFSLAENVSSVVFSGGGGASTINLDQTYPIGFVFNVFDKSGLSAGWPITIDAQSGKTIVGYGSSSQTFVIDKAYQNVILKKVDANTWALLSIGYLTSTANNPVWKKYTLSYTDISAPSNVNTYGLEGAFGGHVAMGAILSVTQAFTGGAISAANVTLNVNTTGDVIGASDIFSGAAQYQATNLVVAPIYSSGALNATFTATGDTWDNATQGLIDIFVLEAYL